MVSGLPNLRRCDGTGLWSVVDKIDNTIVVVFIGVDRHRYSTSLAGIECHASDPFANRPGRGVFGATSGRTMRFVAARSVNAGPISAVVLE
jgi:hypothetical protein